MPATPAQLGARALRKIDIGLIAESSRTPAGPPVSADAAAARVVRLLGLPVAEDARPPGLGTVARAELARRALRAQQVNPVANAVPQGGTVPASVPARRGLLLLGVNPQDAPGAASGESIGFASLAAEVLQKLAVIGEGETPNADQQALATARVTEVHDTLVALGYAAWPLDAIPLAVAAHYVTMACNLLAPAFGLPASLEAFVAAQEMIRAQALTGGIAQARAEQRVASIHDMLTAEGLADWPASAIPLALVDAYAAMVAHDMAPVQGKQADAAAQGAAMAAVRRHVLSGPRGQALAEQEVDAVHDALAAQGIVSWPVSAVPVAHAGHYAAMAAYLLAPILGREAGKGAWEAGEAAIRRAAVVSGATARAKERIVSVAGELSALGMADWDADAIPAALADAVTDLAAQQIGPEFGRAYDPKMYAAAEARIRRTVMGGPRGQALAEQKVRAVQKHLEARGLARWTIYDVPPWAEEPIVFMAATWLAPECDVRPDPAWWAGAERDLMRAVALPSQREPVIGCYF